MPLTTTTFLGEGAENCTSAKNRHGAPDYNGDADNSGNAVHSGASSIVRTGVAAFSRFAAEHGATRAACHAVQGEGGECTSDAASAGPTDIHGVSSRAV